MPMNNQYVVPGSASIAGIDIATLTFEDIRVQYYTGQAFVKSGSGRGREYGYRHGIKTKIGDFEPEQWKKLALALIEREGEELLLKQLEEWEQLTVPPFYKAQTDMEQRALELYCARIFDDENWCDFVRFNEKYRPERLKNVELVDIFVACCQKEGKTTKTLLDRWDQGFTPCPFCGVHTPYKLTSAFCDKEENV